MINILILKTFDVMANFVAVMVAAGFDFTKNACQMVLECFYLAQNEFYIEEARITI